MSKVKPGIGQGMLFVPELSRAPALPPGFDLESRVSFSHLICVISEHMGLPPDYTTQTDLDLVEPGSIEAALCFGTRESRGKNLKNVYMGIGFSATQFMEVARSPGDLARHAYSRSLKANENRPPEEQLDRDEAHATASRAAGHTLEERTMRLEIVKGQLSEQRLSLLALHKELLGPGKAHWTGQNLDDLRKTGSDIIHGDVEIAAVNMPWSHVTVDSMQRALNYNLYGRSGHNNRRIGFWTRYVLMAGKHTRRQLTAVSESFRKTSRELSSYRPFLDAVSVDEP